MLNGIVTAHLGDAEALATVCFNTIDLKQWQWLGDFNRSFGTGGLKGMSEEAKSRLYHAMRTFSTEQFSLAREQLVEVAAIAGQSPVPYWLTAMAWQMEGKSEKADEAMSKADAFMAHLSLAEKKEPTDDGYHFVVCPTCNGTKMDNQKMHKAASRL